MIAIGMRDPQSSRPQIAGCLRQRIRDGQWRTGDLQQNLGGERQRATHRDQGAPCRNVKCSGELQNLLALFVPAAHKYRYGDRETRPLTALCFEIPTLQTDPFCTRDKPTYRTLGAKPAGRGLSLALRNPENSRRFLCNSAITALSNPSCFLSVFAPQMAISDEL